MSKLAIERFYPALVLLALLLSCLTSQQFVYAAESDIRTELESYIDAFNKGSFAEQRKLISTLEWSGISDPKLYDIIAEKLSSRAKQNNREAKEEASWYAKALALSGNEKYRPQLEALASDGASRKLRKHAATALERLDKFVVWNPIISANVMQAPMGQLKEARVKNMLAADNAHVLKLGAKRVHHAHASNKELLQLANQRLLKGYQDAGDDSKLIDAMAWLIRALAQSGDDHYKPTLEQIAETANNKKLKKYAKKHLGSFSG